jgi:hypothetical protein
VTRLRDVPLPVPLTGAAPERPWTELVAPSATCSCTSTLPAVALDYGQIL